MTAATPTPQQHRAMHALWREAGVAGDRAARLALTSAAVGRPLATSNALTMAEAARLIDYMRDLHTEGVLATRAADYLTTHQPRET